MFSTLPEETTNAPRTWARPAVLNTLLTLSWKPVSTLLVCWKPLCSPSLSPCYFASVLETSSESLL